MRVAFISDPHSNLAAVEAVLADINLHSPDSLICLGDFVGYGPNPNEVIELLRRKCAVSLLGNHDLAAISGTNVEYFNAMARAGIEFTQAVLDNTSREFLMSLSPLGSFEELSLVHGSFRDPITEYILSAEIADANFKASDFRRGFFGHTHVPSAFELNDEVAGGALEQGTITLTEKRSLINPGSVGQPRDRDPRAAWALYDTETQELSVRRIEYAIESTQAEMEKAGLPEELIMRLELGI